MTTPHTTPDAAQLAQLDTFSGFSVALIADALDRLGRRDQVMSDRIAQLSGGDILAGYAVTVSVGASFEGSPTPYDKEMEAIELLREGCVLVAATNGPPAAFWGELLTERASTLGARGAIVDGYARDLKQIRERGFPVWACGTNAADSAGRLEAYHVGGAVMCAGVLVRAGDLIVADCDGVIAVPYELVDQVRALVVEKQTAEDAVRRELASGSTMQAVYAKYGVL